MHSKRLLFTSLILIVLTLFYISCSQGIGSTKYESGRNLFKSYRDIPGVTDEDIAQIEALKSSRDNFSFGVILSTETFELPDGSISGFSRLFAERLSGLFGIPFVPEKYEWGKLLDGVNDLSVDFLSVLTPTDERRKRYFMTSPIAERALSVFVKNGASGINDTNDLNDLRVGFLEGTITEQSVRRTYPELVFDTVIINNMRQAAQMLGDESVDAVIVDQVSDYNFSSFGNITGKNILPLVYTPISLATANPGLETVISVVDKYLKAGGLEKVHGFYFQGEKDYAQFMFERSLSPEEKAYIANLTSNGIKVQVTKESDNYPICFYDEKQKEFQGIAVDILNEISSLTGIKFVTVTNKNTTMAEILEIIKSGGAAFDTELIYTEVRKNDFIFPQSPYFSFHFALLSRMDFPDLKIYQAANETVGAVKGTAPAEMFEQLIPGSGGYIEYNTRSEALDALEKGEINLFLTTDYMILYQTHYREKTGYKINIVINSVMEGSFFGFNKNEEILCSIIGKAQNRVDIYKIVSKWTNRVYDYSKKIATDRLISMTIFAAILSILLVFFIILLVKYRRRKVQLEKMSKEIAVQNTLLEAVNHVSSVLLEPNPPRILQSDTEHFEDNIRQSLGILMEAVKVDRICIWVNSGKKSKLSFSLFYELENTAFRSRVKEGFLAPDILMNEHHSWNDALVNGNCINSLVRNMHPAEQAVLIPRSIVSLLVVPVIFNEKLWGFVGFDHCKKELVFKDREIFILRSASRMIANAIIRNEMTAQLEIAKEQAVQSSRSKSTFLSHMSHEIRTPMNAILGIAEIQLQKEAFSHDINEAFEKIYESGDLLLNIINDILDLSKIESGKMEIVPVRYDIPSLINDTVQLSHLRYESKPIEFIMHIEKNIPYELIGDVLRIKQILNNILSNAFKYTDNGTIEFFISVEPEAAQSALPENEQDDVILVIRVSDTGQGMTEDQLERLFDEYVRFNLEKNRTTVGAGLGMSITKRLIDLMNGEIFVESALGKGSVFSLRIPQKRYGQDICNEELIDKLKNFNFHNTTILKKVQFLREYMPYGSVLVVDDVESNIYVARGMLLPYGLKIETVTNGQAAIDKIKAGQSYDIIFMDHMMPKMDGIEAVKIIRGMGYTQPIVALTANALIGRAKMFLQNGFDAFLSKPIDSRELNSILNEFIKNRKPPEVVEAARRIPPAERAALQRQSWDSEDTRAFRIMDFFVRDAEHAINVLEKISIDDTGIDQYIITVHGIKSALANIGDIELSDIAFKLENAARQQDYDLLLNATPAFINALKSLIMRFKYVEEEQNENVLEVSITEENRAFLYEKLNEIKTACASFDKKTAKTALEVLNTNIWPAQIAHVLNDISVCLLHSDFSEIADLVDEVLKAELSPNG